MSFDYFSTRNKSIICCISYEEYKKYIACNARENCRQKVADHVNPKVYILPLNINYSYGCGFR